MEKILFVCVHNSGRSLMAEAFLNQMAKGKAIADSAGTQPANEPNHAVIQAMREEGIDLSQRRPKLLTMQMMQEADRIITMGCGAEAVCPARIVPMEDWGIEDPQGKPIEKVREIRDQIRQKVARLLKDI